MLISIVIPVYNQHPQFVAECIASCKNQILGNGITTEIVVVDDGSTNNWYASVDLSGVHFIHYTKNIGASAAANIGIFNSKGDYIEVLSSDDYFFQHKTDIQYSLMKLNKAELSYTNSTELFLSKNHNIVGVRENRVPIIETVLGKVHFYEIAKNDYSNNFINGASVMFTRELFNRVGMYDETLVYKPDYDLWLRMLDVCRAVQVNLNLMTRRNHDNQTKHIMNMEKGLNEAEQRTIEYAKIKLKWETSVFPVSHPAVDIKILKREGYF